MCGNNNATTRTMKKVCSSALVLLLLVRYAEFSFAAGGCYKDTAVSYYYNCTIVGRARTTRAFCCVLGVQ